VLVCLEDEDRLGRGTRPAEDVAAVRAGKNVTDAPPGGLLDHGPKRALVLLKMWAVL
jgi:hypothetical protein